MSLTGGSKFILTGGANYQIARSLRFRASASAHFKRTFAGAPTSASIGTFSGWVKRGTIASAARQHLLSGYDGSSPFESVISFETDDTLAVQWGGSAANLRKTAALFRDPSAFMHVCIGFTGGTITIEVNGVTQTLSGTAGSGNHQFVKANANNTIGGGWNNPAVDRFCDLLLADLYYIDGQVLAASNFGQTNATTGAWNPIKYTGTYGVNGFYLPFSDNSAATSITIGKDSSGNGNNWTPSGISITAGVTNDSLVDVPTNYGSDTGAGGEVRGNYATMSPFSTSSNITLSNGNLTATWSSQANNNPLIVPFVLQSGLKHYFEFIFSTIGPDPIVGMTAYNVLSPSALAATANVKNHASTIGYLKAGAIEVAGSNVQSSLATYIAGDVIGAAVDYSGAAPTIQFYKNGSAVGTAVSGTTGAQYYPYFSDDINGAGAANFGQRPYAYAAPSGFKALCTQNLSDPAIAKPSQYFDIDTYAGTGATRSKTGLAFQPDFAWFKGRSGATDHAIYDSVRGVQKQLESNTTTAETTETTGLTAFNSDGYTTGALAQLNTSAATYVAWLMKQGAVPGLKITGWTGTGSNLTVPHGAGVTPDFWIGRCRSAAHEGIVWHKNLGTPSTAYLILDTTAAQGNSSTVINGAPDATNIYLGVNNNLNDSGNDHIGYFFNEIAGFSKFSSYTGNGSADGPFVWCGFRPRYVLIKRTDSTGEWVIYDTVRNTYNLVNASLSAQSSAAEVTGNTNLDVLANGFKIRTTDSSGNWNGSTYIFAAFAEAPFKTTRAR